MAGYPGNNGKIVVDLPFAGANQIWVEFSGSGSIVDIQWNCPTSSTSTTAAATTTTTIPGTNPAFPTEPSCATCAAGDIEYFYFKYNTNEAGSVDPDGIEYTASSINSGACKDYDPIGAWLTSQGLSASDVNDSFGLISGSDITITPFSSDKPNGYITVDLPDGYWVIEEAHHHKGGNACYDGTTQNSCSTSAYFDITQDSNDSNPKDISHVAFIFAKCSGGGGTTSTCK